jgi:hypothetical protein
MAKSSTERVKDFRARTADEYERLQLRLKIGTKERLLKIAQIHDHTSITSYLEALAADHEKMSKRTNKNT